MQPIYTSYAISRNRLAAAIRDALLYRPGPLPQYLQEG